MWPEDRAEESRSEPKSTEVGSAPWPSPPTSRYGTLPIQSVSLRVAQTRTPPPSSERLSTPMPGEPKTTMSVTPPVSDGEPPARGMSGAAVPQTTEP